ncbi:MAG: cell division protein FtsL [Methylophilaceae bacterium]|jgi:cell division protein FtsL
MNLNFILFILLIFFALAKVNFQHQYRTLHSKLEIENQITLELRDEKIKLQIEESNKSANGRIQEIAKNRLGMRVPKKNQKKIIINK